MFKVIEKESKLERNFNTLDEAIDFIANQVKERTYELYDNDEIDKYAVEDILWNIKDYIRKNMGLEYSDLVDFAYDATYVIEKVE